MSRSYRKAYYTCGYGCRGRMYAKRDANKAVRRYTEDLADGSSYRKVFDSWNICDYRTAYDPRPYWSRWRREWIDPEPLWKVTRK